MRIAYICQDVADPAVGRRVAMLRRGGAEVDLYGFCRRETVPSDVGGVRPVSLGRTHDGQLARRVWAVVVRSLTVGKWARRIADADLVIARNLESMALAKAIRRRFRSPVPLVYELLDIHSLMLDNRAHARLLRGLEGAWLSSCAAIMTSSMAFEREYLTRYYRRLPPTILVENRVFGDIDLPPSFTPRPVGPPWRIGWSGIIRCRKSFLYLKELAARHPGLVEVHISGRIATTAIGDIESVIDQLPGFYFHGSYQYPQDLRTIFDSMHFVWAIDFYEDGANSAWLLPNRLYEGGLYGAVPIALGSVETGRWLNRHDVGIVVDGHWEEGIEHALTSMTPEIYGDLRAALQIIDPARFRWSDAGCRDLTGQLAQLCDINS